MHLCQQEMGISLLPTQIAKDVMYDTDIFILSVVSFSAFTVLFLGKMCVILWNGFKWI